MTEFTWQEKGGLLALAIGADDKTGNGVQLYDPETEFCGTRLCISDL